MSLKQEEPVRLAGWTAVAVGTALIVTVGVLAGADWRAVAIVALVAAAGEIGGLEWARNRVRPWTPAQDNLEWQVGDDRPDDA